jgi:ATP-dependent Lhr-like helicase
MATQASICPHDVLANFQEPLRRWFLDAFDQPTPVQAQAWPLIADGKNTLMLAPTGSGKTLAAFLVAIHRIMFPAKEPPRPKSVQVIYVSPLKALGVDIERNLRAPLAGVRTVAEREGVPHHEPRVAVRSGDTPAQDRQRMLRNPPDILITTPESLYLILTSRAREILQATSTLIVDEIHSLVGTKRGAHLFVTLERLEKLRRDADPSCAPLQRLGLSATQRPLDEVARLLGGADATHFVDEAPRPRPVEIVEAGRGKQLDLRIEVPVEDMAQLAQPVESSGRADAGPTIPSIWPAIHPRLVELIRTHRSTMIFVNSRRLAERLSAAINELADEEIALAHHGSIAKEQRLQIEDRLKRGQLPAIVATSSLELGIDMGAVDLVIQIEAPPSIASGIQRIGRAGHQVGALSSGVIFPKYRGDLVACSAATQRMMLGQVEATYYPRNPLDVLAQQIVAMVAEGPIPLDDLYATMRGAAPFFDLPRSSFENVLDLLAGRYPADEFSELRPRVVWDRIAGVVSPRRGTQRVAVLNAGTIPDRGLYGVYLGDEQAGGSRVGELDEEMVFEMHPGDVFLLGASSWRVLEITHDRVLVAPAPGEPGRMPFWRGDGPGRPLEFGLAIGELIRRFSQRPHGEAVQELTQKHGLEEQAARNLLQYLADQAEATTDTPHDRSVLVESFLDEIGDWRIAVLSPFGARVHAPWALAVAAKLRQETPGEVDMMWSDDGIVFRMPESDDVPPPEFFFPASDEVEDLVVQQLASTALFAAHFRENAARALLLPKRQPRRRSPLWLQRRRAADLLAVASQYPSFPIMLETYRECLRDVFDIQGLRTILQDVERRRITVRGVRTSVASPFAASLMFNYTANFLYNGDTPVAERRAQALALDHAQLRELLGDAELRELLDRETIEETALELARLSERFHLRHEDALHELLLYAGDLTREELAARCVPQTVTEGTLDAWLTSLTAQRRVIQVRIAGQVRYAAAEDAARLRDALGSVPPVGLPEAFLQSVPAPMDDLVSRFARTHVPFRLEDVARRFGVGVAVVRDAVDRLTAKDRVLVGEFLPGGFGREWCDADVLRKLKRRSLARLRKQIEPVEAEALARFLPVWQSITQPRRGLDGLLDVVEQLQGVALPVSALEQHILPNRVQAYDPGDLDELCIAGEVVWRGFDGIGTDDGRIALYLTDALPLLAPEPQAAQSELAEQIRDLLAARGASFFDEIAKTIGGFRNDLFDALWQLVWAGLVTNDTLAPLRSLGVQRRSSRPRRRTHRRAFRSRRSQRTPGTEGRWSLLPTGSQDQPTTTLRQTELAAQLLRRYGVLTREMVTAENVGGGFAGLYPVLKAMEEAGRIRRGYFVAGLGAAQFAASGAEDLLRNQSKEEEESPTMVLAATDPANPYGVALPWPKTPEDGTRPQRSARARVILWRGRLVGFLSGTNQQVTTYLPDAEAERSAAVAALVQALCQLADKSTPVFLASIDGKTPGESTLAASLRNAGFVSTSRGYLLRRRQA